MNNIILFIQEYTSKMSCRIITSVLSLLFSPFPVLKASSLEFVHPWRVWKTRNVIQSRKALVRHAVMMETEVHARNWSFVIAPSSTIQSLPTFPERRRAPLTGRKLFSIKRANAIQTLLDMTAASASLATMANTRHRKSPDSQKFPQVVSRGEGSIHEVHQHVQLLHKRLCGDFDPIWRDQKTVMANRDQTALFHDISKCDLFLWIYYYAARGIIFKHNITRGDIDFANDGQGLPTWHRLYNTVE